MYRYNRGPKGGDRCRVPALRAHIVPFPVLTAGVALAERAENSASCSKEIIWMIIQQGKERPKALHHFFFPNVQYLLTQKLMGMVIAMFTNGASHAGMPTTSTHSVSRRALSTNVPP